jgi:hypothetical protein
MPPRRSDKEFQQLQAQVRELERRVANIPARWTPPSFLTGGYWAVLTSQSSDSDNKWSYEFHQVYLDNDDEWQELENGRSGTFADGTYAINSREYLNAATGRQGNGVDVANLNAGLALVHSTLGWPVWMRDVRKPDGTIRPVFIDPNGIDGICV